MSKAFNADLFFRSDTDEWSTPSDFFASVDAEFGFTLDVCANADNAKCPDYFDKERDGLLQRWSGTCWMNPPYGETIGLWMRKAWMESQRGCRVVCLVPARTDTAWWHDWAMRGEIRFLRGRLKFGGSDKDAPFPSALVIFEAQDNPENVFRQLSLEARP